ncbi:MAG: DUF5680 domain-containing protein [Candidatus Moraniibacteriota bacterium]|jgi:hypothetical protein
MDAVDVTLEQIEDIFFKTMCQGYVSNAKVEKYDMPGMPGYKCITFRSEDFVVHDAYCTTPLSNMSSGFTTIWFKDTPVWTMKYGGQYSPDCIPLLKLALRKTYQQHIFRGCRGPSRCASPDKPQLVYFNDVEDESDFAQFAGRESIILTGVGEAGFHRYFGMALI